MQQYAFWEAESRSVVQQIQLPVTEQQFSIPRSSKPVTAPYAKPVEYSEKFHTPCFSKIHFNIILPSTRMSTFCKLYFLQDFRQQFFCTHYWIPLFVLCVSPISSSLISQSKDYLRRELTVKLFTTQFFPSLFISVSLGLNIVLQNEDRKYLFINDYSEKWLTTM
jgi:hypothetical protein